MGRQLPIHLSYKSALALLPPSSITAPIETIRRAHDENFARWPPHINLLYPFLASPVEAEQEDVESGSAPALKSHIRARIQQAVKSIEPFHISLETKSAGMGVFSHSKTSKTVWIGPSTQRVQDLQAALQAEFAECEAKRSRFTPHLSLGQANSDSAARKLKQEAKSTIAGFVGQEGPASPSLDWHVDKIYVIARKAFDSRFDVVGSIDLGE